MKPPDASVPRTMQPTGLSASQQPPAFTSLSLPRLPLPAMTALPISPKSRLTMSTHLARLVLCLLLHLSAQSTWGSWQYSSTVCDFTYTAAYDQTAGEAYEGTARITGYTGTASIIVIPPDVSFNAIPSGQNVTVNCTITAIHPCRWRTLEIGAVPNGAVLSLFSGENDGRKPAGLVE